MKKSVKKIRVFVFALVLCFFAGQGTFIFAQGFDDDDGDFEDDPPFNEGVPDDDWYYMPDMYTRGDQTFTFNVGLITPLFFINQGSVMQHNFTPPVGGTGTISYLHFLGPVLAIGGEIGFQFNYTLAENVIYFIPIGFRTSWQFLFRRFEFPLSVTTGIVFHRYLNTGYVGPFLKGGAAAFFRATASWSFGLSSEWTLYPQWPREDGVRVPSKDVYANIQNITLAARYHF
jgi:hypothetical protein